LDIIERGKKSIMGRRGGFGVGERERGEYASAKEEPCDAIAMHGKSLARDSYYIVQKGWKVEP
jgi:hypothetical protein